MKAHRVKPGSTIGIVALGSSASPENFSAGVRVLKQLGFDVKCPIDPTANFEATAPQKGKNWKSSAPKEQRARAFMELIDDATVSAVVAARGGYGTVSVLPLLDFPRIKQAKKLFVGFSDLTLLLGAVSANCNLPAIHGPMIAAEFAASENSAEAKDSVEFLLKMLSDPDFLPSHKLTVLREGHGKGKIVVGNLTMFLSLLGTPWDISFEDAILVLEDVNEAPYQVHRGLMQLKMAGKLDSLQGCVFGRFCDPSSPYEPEMSAMFAASVDEIFGGEKYPVLCGLECGHSGRNLSLPFGCRAEISKEDLNLLESPVE